MVLGVGVVVLVYVLGWVVVFLEYLQQFRQVDDGGIEYYFYDFCVFGQVGIDFFVGWVWGYFVGIVY